MLPHSRSLLNLNCNPGNKRIFVEGQVRSIKKEELSIKTRGTIILAKLGKYVKETKRYNLKGLFNAF